MRRRRRSLTDVDFWPAFTDVLSGMLLVMVFALTVFALAQAGLMQVVGGKDAALRSLEAQVSDLRQLLRQTEARAEQLRSELVEATMLLESLAAQRDDARDDAREAAGELSASEAEVLALSRQIAEYTAQVRELNERLALAEREVENRDASIGDLQLAVNRLRAQLAQMSSDLAAAEKQAQEWALRVSDLLAELARKDERIEKLEPLEKYTSEFLAKMSEVFADNPNIKVVGDRFVFQSEVLFASGSADLGEAGQGELDKLVRAIRELAPRIPESLNVNIQVQGHTDTDPLRLSETFNDNWELSAARALEVVDYLAARGVPERMLSAAGFGEYQPRVRGTSEAAKAQNRRIEIRITQI